MVFFPSEGTSEGGVRSWCRVRAGQETDLVIRGRNSRGAGGASRLRRRQTLLLGGMWVIPTVSDAFQAGFVCQMSVVKRTTRRKHLLPFAGRRSGRK